MAIAWWYTIIVVQRNNYGERYFMKNQVSWFWIVLAFIFFWPLGLFLLLRRTSGDRTATLKGGRTLKIVAVILFIVGGLMIMSLEPFGIVWGSIIVIGGMFVYWRGKKADAQVVRYKQYLDLIVNQSQTSILSIAAIVGVPADQVAGELQIMIDSSFFVGARIDYATHEIVLRSAEPMVSVAIQPGAAPAPMARAVTCGSCGANNRLTGAAYECEYCGSPLQ